MFHLGTPEIIVILAVALIVFGPKKLPEIGRSIGKGLRELKKASRDITDTLEGRDFEPEELPERPPEQPLPPERTWTGSKSSGGTSSDDKSSDGRSSDGKSSEHTWPARKSPEHT